MSQNILVASPHVAFGELLRLSLEESGRYIVYLTHSGTSALDEARLRVFSLAILDSDLADLSLATLSGLLLECHPQIRVMVIPPENDPTHPALENCTAHAYLLRPFYLPELLERVHSLLGSDAQGEQASPGAGGNGRAREWEAISTEPALQEQADSPIARLTLPPSENLAKDLSEKFLWLKDQSLASQVLESLLLQSSARSILVIQEDRILASTHQILDKVAVELVNLLGRYWNKNRRSDLVRFSRLETNGEECLLYATSLVSNLVLLAVYDAQTPLSRCRNQVQQMAHSFSEIVNQPPAYLELINPPLSTSWQDQAHPQPAIQQEEPRPAEPQPTALREDKPESGKTEPGESIELARLAALSQETTFPEPTNPQVQEGSAEESLEETDLEEVQAISLAQLLATLPPPNPEKETPAINKEWVTSSPEDNSMGNEPAVAFPWEQAPASSPVAAEEQPESELFSSPTGLDAAEALPIAAAVLPSFTSTSGEVISPPDREISPPALPSSPVEESEPLSQEQGKDDLLLPWEQQATSKSETLEELPAQPAASAETAQAESAGTALSEESQVQQPILSNTQPTRIQPPIPQASEDSAFPVADTFLYYTCILIPRLPKQFLAGPLADQMIEWVPQICLAFGWFLDRVLVRPDYLQWTVQVTPSVSPGNLVRFMRLRTSEYIFKEFPDLKKGNPVEDFWAPGYLVASGSQPPSTHLLRDFIRETRIRQGFKKP